MDNTNLVFWGDMYDIENLKHKIKNDLETVSTWVESNTLVLNTDKTKYIVLSTRYRLLIM